jgi:hypothetical protein
MLKKGTGKKQVGCEVLRDLLESERNIRCCRRRLEASRIIERLPGQRCRSEIGTRSNAPRARGA